MILPIDKERVPYQFEIELDGEIFTFEVHYNGENDFFTIDLYKDDEVVVYGEKIIYGRQLFKSIADLRLPKTPIIPLDPSGQAKRVGYSELGETVFLYIGGIEDAGTIRQES